MSIFDKKKVAFMLACTSFFGGKNSLAVKSSNSVGGVVTSRKKMSNLTKGLITGGSIVGVSALLYVTGKKWMTSKRNEKKIEVLNNILKKIGEVDTKIRQILSVKQNGNLIDSFSLYIEKTKGKTGIAELDYFEVNDCKLYNPNYEYKDEVTKVDFVSNSVKQITNVFDKKISPNMNGNDVDDTSSIKFDKNEDVVVDNYPCRWNIQVDKGNKKLKITQKSIFFIELPNFQYALEIDLEKFGLSDLLEEYPS